jgi:hypothetical protein
MTTGIILFMVGMLVAAGIVAALPSLSDRAN